MQQQVTFGPSLTCPCMPTNQLSSRNVVFAPAKLLPTFISENMARKLKINGLAGKRVGGEFLPDTTPLASIAYCTHQGLSSNEIQLTESISILRMSGRDRCCKTSLLYLHVPNLRCSALNLGPVEMHLNLSGEREGSCGAQAVSS